MVLPVDSFKTQLGIDFITIVCYNVRMDINTTETREEVLEAALAIFPDPVQCITLATKSLESMRLESEYYGEEWLARAEQLIEDLNKLVDK